jgi:hypothetical protein
MAQRRISSWVGLIQAQGALRFAGKRICILDHMGEFFPAPPGMAGQGQTGRQNQNLLPRWLVTPQDDNRREYTIGSDHQGRYRNVAVFGRVLKCQLRAENVKKDAAQGGGVDTDARQHAQRCVAGLRYGTLYGTPETSTPVSD